MFQLEDIKNNVGLYGKDNQTREQNWLSEMVSEIEVIPQKMVDSKTVVLKTRFDSNMARLQAERLKQKFFVKLGFFKTKKEEIQLVGSEKYYEPYLVIGGKYSLDYCKKHTFSVEVEKTTKEIYVAGTKFKPTASIPDNNLNQTIHLEGEEHAHYEKESFFVLDRLRREISPESYSFAPYESQLEEIADSNLNLRRISISNDEIIELLRSKIAKRPTDLVSIIREIFEINENTIVYRPFFEFTFHNTKTNEYVTLQVDGISGDKILYKYDTRNTQMYSSNSNFNCTSFSKTEAKPISADSKKQYYNQSSVSPKTGLAEPNQYSEPRSQEKDASVENVTLKFPANVLGEIFVVGDNVTAVVGDLEIPSGVTVNDTLVVKGNLKIGHNCRLSRKVKVLGDIAVGTNTIIDGDLVSGGNITIGSGSEVGGCIKAAGKVKFGGKVTVGKATNTRSNRVQKPFDLRMIVDFEREKASV